MRRTLAFLILCMLAFVVSAQQPSVEWLPPSVDLEAKTATFYLPDLQPGMTLDHAVVVRDGKEIGPATGDIDLGLLTYDCEIWVRVYIVGEPPMDGPHVVLHLGGGRQT